MTVESRLARLEAQAEKRHGQIIARLDGMRGEVSENRERIIRLEERRAVMRELADQGFLEPAGDMPRKRRIEGAAAGGGIMGALWMLVELFRRMAESGAPPIP